MGKYLKVMFGTTSGADKNLEYKIGEVNVANSWNPTETKGRNFGGFNFSTEDKIIRWLHRGDTLYDVEIPKDAAVIDIVESATPHGVLRTNKIIIKNPRKITDEMALEFYEKSTIPEIAYYKTLGVVSIMGYEKTALRIFRDKVNKDNIDIVLDEWNNFIKRDDRDDCNETVNLIEEYLNEVKSDILISRFVDKEPYVKTITSDKIINLTGESGSGKSFYTNQYLDDDNYIVIDTDIVFSDKPSTNKESLEIRELFKDRDKEDLINDFDGCYLQILDYFKDSDKTIVVDSAQYRNIKDYSILKGQIIVMRTSIETCYERCLNRWKQINKDYAKEDFIKYANKKSAMFKWYKGLNRFILELDKI